MKARNGCWTCKQRKIGCDRSLPGCQNCSRSERQCLGYGLRLTWPGGQHGRRRRDDISTYEPPSTHATKTQYYGKQFLSFGAGDIVASRDYELSHNLCNQYLVERPQPTLSLHSPIVGQNAMLMSYYELVISPMVSTTNARNGFYSEVLPMALSCRSASASALSNAILAISAYHHFGPEAAAMYKLHAVSRLSESLSSQCGITYNDISETQLAASMMLAMYSVFDNDDGNWHIHLDGCRGLIQMSAACQARSPSTFLLTWLLYYEVLGNFTRPSHVSSYDVGAACIQGSKIEGSNVIGHLGCSVEVLEIIHEINGIRSRSSRNADPQSLITDRLRLDQKLQVLNQCLHPEENLCATPGHGRALITAELYRIAALLYLQRVCPIDGDHSRRVNYLDQAFDAYKRLEVATSPWPLFVVACESRKEEDRITILEILDKMDRIRSIGNLCDMRNIIELYWKQCDLRIDMDQTRQLKWWLFVDCSITVPWFV